MYAKVFAQIYDGSLCTKGPWQVLVTFQQMLVLADQDGVVDMTAEAISRRTTIPLEIIQQGIYELLKPDDHSRTPIEEGRRILPLSPDRDWGWRIVNYKHYRNLKREEDRREYHRNYWHKRKTQNTQQTQQNQPITEAEANAKELTTLSGKPDVFAQNSDFNASVKLHKERRSIALEVLSFLNEKAKRNYRPVKANIEPIVARLKDGATLTELRQVVAKKTREWGGDEKMAMYLRPATLFNATKFAQYQGELV